MILKKFSIVALFLLLSGCGLLVEKESVWINSTGERAGEEELRVAMLECEYAKKINRFQQLSAEMQSKTDMTDKEFTTFLNTSSELMQSAFSCMREEGMYFVTREKE